MLFLKMLKAILRFGWKKLGNTTLQMFFVVSKIAALGTLTILITRKIMNQDAGIFSTKGFV